MENMMWEILVPVVDKNEKNFSIDHHQEWDRYVIHITGGLTIAKQAKGKWISPIGGQFFEKMIPVRIICGENEINQIVDFTIRHYDQEAVLAYKISNNVVLKYRNPEDK